MIQQHTIWKWEKKLEELSPDHDKPIENKKKRRMKQEGITEVTRHLRRKTDDKNLLNDENLSENNEINWQKV